MLAHLLAGVDVEEFHRFQQLTAASDKGLAHLGSGDLLVHDESDVLLGHREGGEPPDGTATRSSSNQRVEIQLDCAGASRQTSLSAHGGVQLTGMSDDLSCNDEFGTTPRMPRHQGSSTTLQFQTNCVTGLLGQQHGMGPVHLDGCAIPAIRKPVSGEQSGQHPRLGGQGCCDLSEFCVAGAMIDGRTRRSGLRRGTEDSAGLEDGKIILGT